jgi:ribonuclease E
LSESHTHQDARPADADGEERRERRSRDRYGRDRRERGERQPQGDAPVAGGDAPPAQTADGADQERTPRYPTGFVAEDEQTASQALAPQATHRSQAAAPSPAVREPAVPTAPAVQAQGLPRVRPFELPVNDLAQVAEGSGLQWVNSDAQKIAAVQAAIAAEPRPQRVPRERPAATVADEGPLVLVETRRDLRDMQLPFEQDKLPPQ